MTLVLQEKLLDGAELQSVEIDVNEGSQSGVSSGPAGPAGSAGVAQTSLRQGLLGEITDDEVPLVYCVRLLCNRFLLTGFPMGLIPDRQVGRTIANTTF